MYASTKRHQEIVQMLRPIWILFKKNFENIYYGNKTFYRLLFSKGFKLNYLFLNIFRPIGQKMNRSEILNHID